MCSFKERMMDEILDEIGLADLKQIFNEHKIGPKEVLTLREEDFQTLGMKNIGDRARLRNRCHAALQLPESPTLLKLRELSDKRKVNIRSRKALKPRCASSDTRRVHCGWMNKKKKNSVFARVSGGKTVIDIEKTATLPQVKSILTNMYFPEGENKPQNLRLSDVDCYVGNYGGAQLKNNLGSGEEFTIENYYKEIKTYPIRVYLFTSPKDSDDEGLPDLQDISKNSTDSDVEFVESSVSTPLPRLRLKKSRSCKLKLRWQQADIQDLKALMKHEPMEVSREKKSMRTQEQTNQEHPRQLPAVSQSTSSAYTPTVSVDGMSREDNHPQSCAVTQCTSSSSTSTPTVSDVAMVEQVQHTDEFTEHKIPPDSGTPTVIFNRISRAAACKKEQEVDKENLTAADILRELQCKIKKDGKKNVINVDRNNILSVKNSFKKDKFMEDHQLFVRFSGERGIDDGGPSREFMRMIMKALNESTIFEGKDSSKMLLQNLLAEEQGDYQLYGKIIACCLVHGGPSPAFFSEFMYGLIAYGPEKAEPTLDDITDKEYKEQVQKIESSTDIASFFDAVDPIRPLLDYIGALPLALPSKKNQLVQALCRHVAVTRVEKSLEQFRNGLNCLGVLDKIKSYPDVLRDLFVYKEKELDAVDFDNMFNVVFSQEGSNKYIEELRVQTYWRDYLQEIEDTQDKFKELLSFITGLESEPPLGFSPTLSLKFLHPESNQNFTMFATPYANTCTNTLHIPVTETYEIFKEVMNNVLNLGCLFTDH